MQNHTSGLPLHPRPVHSQRLTVSIGGPPRVHHRSFFKLLFQDTAPPPPRKKWTQIVSYRPQLEPGLYIGAHW